MVGVLSVCFSLFVVVVMNDVVFYYENDVFYDVYVVYWVVGDGDDVGDFVGFDVVELVFEVEKFGCVYCGVLQSLGCWYVSFDYEVEFFGV